MISSRRNRVFPALLLKDNGLVKTFNFESPKYVGDPINAIKIFNEKQVDELVLLNIDERSSFSINFDLIEKISKQCRMPLSYGGGITSMDDVNRLVSLGVERIVFSSSVFDDPDLVKNAVKCIGSQSVAVVVNYKIVTDFFGSKTRRMFTKRGSKKIGDDFSSAIKFIESLKVGEIIFQCIDNDGLKSGLDISLIETVYNDLETPFSVLGGLSSLDEIVSISDRFPNVGISAGAFFVFTGKVNSVLISYLD